MEISDETLENLQAKAQQGDLDAQYELGWRHAIGMGAELAATMMEQAFD